MPSVSRVCARASCCVSRPLAAAPPLPSLLALQSIKVLHSSDAHKVPTGLVTRFVPVSGLPDSKHKAVLNALFAHAPAKVAKPSEENGAGTHNSDPVLFTRELAGSVVRVCAHPLCMMGTGVG